MEAIERNELFAKETLEKNPSEPCKRAQQKQLVSAEIERL
jgi:hypothetical protein